jgi:pilus assembly protein CpaF
MPLVASQAWLAEKLAAYQIRNPLPAQVILPDDSGDMAAKPVFDLEELVSAICSRILLSDPNLVADVAAGRINREALTELIGRTAEKESIRAGFFKADLIQKVMDFLFGYGPLQPLIENEGISDIDGTGPGEFTVKIGGQRQIVSLSFPNEQAFDAFCRLAIIRNGGIINENDSHCRVSDERYRLRINVSVPPRSVNGPVISIRKHRRQHLDLNKLTVEGMLDRALAHMLDMMAKSNATVIFCGKGAAGKTTLMRAFIHAMPALERVLIAESDTEIYPEKACCMVQKTKKPHEGGRPVTLRDLVGDGLTMSLDTYCIGEIVGEEAMEFIRAAFSGHRCLATIHANCAADALDRLILLAGPAAAGQSMQILKRMLGRCVDYIVSLKDFRVTQVLQVMGFDESRDVYDMSEIWPERTNPTADAAACELALPLVPGEGRPSVCF